MSADKFTGYYSSLKIITEGDEKFIQKQITLPLSLKEVQDLEQRIRLQRKSLAGYGVPLPSLVNIDIVQLDDCYNLLIKEKFEGLDFADVVDDSNLEFYIDKLLNDIYKPLLNSTNEQYLKAGIDTSVRNFVYRPHEQQFCYVDFIPPKVYYKGHYSQELPEIEGPFYDIRMFGHNDRAGVIYVQYVNLIRLFPTKRKFLRGKIQQFLEKNNLSDLKKYIDNSPFGRIQDKNEAIELVKSLDSWEGENYYYLREAICYTSEVIEDFGMDDVKKMFALTHHETDHNSEEYGRLPQAKFKQVKEELIKNLSR